MKNYDGVGQPPFCVITAKADKSNPPDLSFSVNFGDHIKELKIKRAAEVSLTYSTAVHVVWGSRYIL